MQTTSHKVFQIVDLSKKQAQSVCGSLTTTSKMPCKSYSLPTEACKTGFKMAKTSGSICASCYADKGNYKRYENGIKPAQFARLDSLEHPYWVSGIVALIGSDAYFRWHDSGDLQDLEHLEKIAEVARLTPNCQHWLPTREYSIIKAYIEKHGKAPHNLTIRLSAMYPDKPVIIPKSLQGVSGITASNVHTKPEAVSGTPCKSTEQQGECRDCRLCWSDSVISYAMH